MTSPIYTITDKDGLPIFLRNNQDFKDESGLAPKVGEKITTLFTRPLYAFKYIVDNKVDNAYCFIIRNQKDFDFIVYVSKGEGVARLGCNVCLDRNVPHERLYPLFNIDKLSSFDNFVAMFNKTEKCDICFDDAKIAKELGAETRVPMLDLSWKDNK